MDSHLATLQISLDADIATEEDEDFETQILNKVVDKANEAVTNGDLSPDTKDTFKTRFTKEILYLSDLVDTDSDGKIDKCTVTISAHNMRNLTGYDWAREKTIQLEIKYDSQSVIVSTEDSETEEIASTEDSETEEIASTEDSETEEIVSTEDSETEEIVSIEDSETEEIASTEDSETEEIVSTEDSETEDKYLPTKKLDPEFMAYLNKELPKEAFDADGNIKPNAQSVRELDEINVPNKGIKSLEGIQYFTGLEKLECDSNELEQLDISKNEILERLTCSNCGLDKLDVSKNTKLKFLHCDQNSLEKLDLSHNLKLTKLRCSNNQLSVLDLNEHSKLEMLDCNNNQLTKLDVGKNKRLSFLDCQSNKFKKIDVSNNLKLNYLKVSHNQLKELDLAKNAALKYLSCDDNQIKKLNISHNSFLYGPFRALIKTDEGVKIIDIDEEALKGLNEESFASIERKRVPIEIKDNDIGDIVREIPGLGALKNDDIDLKYHNDKGTLDVTIKNHCNPEYKPQVITLTGFEKLVLVEIADANFRTYLKNLEELKDAFIVDKMDPNAQSVKDLDKISVPNKGIKSLEGIQYFTGLEKLECDSNELEQLNVSKNEMLESLTCSNCGLDKLDVSKNTELDYLNCGKNKLAKLDLSKNVNLQNIDCRENVLRELDLGEIAEIWDLLCQGNSLEKLDVSHLLKLAKLFCDNNQLSVLDTSKNPNLRLLSCKNNKLTKLDPGKAEFFSELYCQSNKLKKIDVSNCLRLDYLYVYDNQLEELYLKDTPSLKYLSCQDNQIKKLDISHNYFLYGRCRDLMKTDKGVQIIDIDEEILKGLNEGSFTSKTSYASLDKERIPSEISNEDIRKVVSYIPGLGAVKNDDIELKAHNDKCTLDVTIKNHCNPEYKPQVITLTGFKKLMPGEIIDDNFRTYLEGLEELKDAFKDGKINPDAQSVKDLDEINVPNKGIKSLKGIQYFTGLEILDCDGNELEQLDVSRNIKLNSLSCAKNHLIKLDLSQNTGLHFLWCNDNNLKSIDVSKNRFLQQLNCQGNSITELDITFNDLLRTNPRGIKRDGNVTIFDLSPIIDEHKLPSQVTKDDIKNAGSDTWEDNDIDLNADDEMGDLEITIRKHGGEKVYPFSGFKTTKDVVEALTPRSFESIISEDKLPNKVTSAEVLACLQKIPGLGTLQESDIELQADDVKGDLKVSIIRQHESDKPGLYKVIPLTGFKTALGAEGALDPEFMEYLNGILPEDAFKDGKIDPNAKSVKDLDEINVPSKGIKSLEGIQYFTGLENLTCPENKLTRLDLSKNLNLERLFCTSNPHLNTLVLGANSKLEYLNCIGCQLTGLDLSKCSNLHDLYCSDNQIEDLDISKTPLSKSFYKKDKESGKWTIPLSRPSSRGLIGPHKSSGTLEVDGDVKITDYYDKFDQKAFKSIVSDKKFPSAVTKDEIRAISDLSALTDAEIGLDANDKEGELTVTIKGHGADQPINLEGFKKSVLVEIPDDNFRTYLEGILPEDAFKDGKINPNAKSVKDLDEINVPNKGIKSLEGIQYFTGLKKLSCSHNNELGKLDVSHNEMLEHLSCTNCGLDKLDVSHNTRLKVFAPSLNELERLDVSSNKELEQLACVRCHLHELNVSQNKKLKMLNCFTNHLGQLDVRQNIELESLLCFGNQLEELDISNNPVGKLPYKKTGEFWVSGSKLEVDGDVKITDYYDTFDQKAFKSIVSDKKLPSLVTRADIRKIPGLSALTDAEIELDDKEEEGKLTVTIKGHGADQPIDLEGFKKLVLVEIPDDNFRTYLEGLKELKDAFKDGKMNPEAPSVKNKTSLVVANKGIESLEGIQYFTGLNKLYCQDNQLSELDLSKNTKLTYLKCSNNKLTELIVSSNLKTLTCSGNKLTDLNVIENIEYLDCNNNNISQLNVSQNTELYFLNCHKNKLKNLNVSQNTKLVTLDCNNNQLSELDVSQNAKLVTLDCNNNQLDKLDLSHNTKLMRLYCQTNQIGKLDISNSPVGKLPYEKRAKHQDFLASVGIGDQAYFWQSANLNVDGNVEITDYYDTFDQKAFKSIVSDKKLPSLVTKADIKKIPGLSALTDAEIELDDKEEEGKLTVTIKGHGADQPIDLEGFKKLVLVEIPDDNFRTYLEGLKELKDAFKDGKMNPEAPSIKNITEIDVPEKGIESLTGIEYFVNLKTLYCQDNQLSKLDISNNTKLMDLKCNKNQLSKIDLGKNTELIVLKCFDNNLGNLDISNNKKLQQLYCQRNQLSKLDVSQHADLNILNCDENRLENIDVTNDKKLKTLYCSNNQLSDLNVKSNKKLKLLSCNVNQLSELDVSQNAELALLYCSRNSLKGLNLRGNPMLMRLGYVGNKITELDITYNPWLINNMGIWYKGDIKIIDIDEEVLKDLRKKSFASIDRQRVPSEIRDNDIGDIVREIPGLGALKDEDITLYPEGKGTLEVYIRNHCNPKSDPKFIALTGFQTKAEAAEELLTSKVQSLTPASFKSIVSNEKLSIEVTKTDIKEILGLDALEDRDIRLRHDVDKGELICSITGHGADRNISVPGFKTTNDVVQALTEDDFDSFDRVKPASQVKSEEILAFLQKKIPGLKSLKPDDVLWTFWPADADKVDAKGEVTVTIRNHGDAPQVITLAGFPTATGVKETALEDKVQSLTKEDFRSLDKKRLPSAVTEAEVLAFLQKIAGLEDLKRDDIDLLSTKKAAKKSTLTVVIKNYGETKAIILKDFYNWDQAEEADLKARVKKLDVGDFDSLKEKLPSAVTEADIRAIPGLGNLKNKDIKFGPKDDQGHLVVMILHHGGNKAIYLEGFKTKAEAVEEALRAKVQSLTPASFDKFGKDKRKEKLPSAVLAESETAKAEILGILQKIPGLGTLELNNIELGTPNDDAGTLTVTITGHGAAKPINLSGFKTTAEAADELLTAKVQSLKPSDFGSIVSHKKLPSLITKADIQKIPGLSDLTDHDIKELAPDEDKGELSFIIRNHGRAKLINLTGFQTKAEAAEEALTAKVQSLKPSDLNSIISDQKVPSEVLAESETAKAEILGILQKIPGLGSLERNNIELGSPNDDAGTLTVTITGHGADKPINLSGFKTTEAVVQSLTPSDLNSIISDQKVPSEVLAESETAKAEILGILQKIPGLGSLERNNIELGSPNDDAGTLTVTITGHGADKPINLSGFKTTEAVVQSLTPSDLNSIISDQKVPSEVLAESETAKAEILGILQKIPGLGTLERNNIELDSPNDKDGELTVKITGHGADKFINLSGFRTTGDVLESLMTDKDKAKSYFEEIISEDKLPSEVTKAEILDILQKIPGLKSLEMKFIIKLDPKYKSGELVITTLYKGDFGVIVLEGFQTTEGVVQSLTKDDFESLDKKRLSSAVTEAEILDFLKKIPGLSYLTDDDISVTGDQDKLLVVILHYGDQKQIVVEGFQTTAEAAKEKALTAKVQSLSESSYLFSTLISDPKQLASAITKDDIRGLQDLSNLKDEDIDLDANDKEGKLTVILKNHGPDKTIIQGGFKKKN